MRHQIIVTSPLARTLAGLALCAMALLFANNSRAQAPTMRGTPVAQPNDCRTGACAQSQSGLPGSATPMTAEHAAAAMAGYWAANNRVSFLIFSEGDGVARLVEVVNGQVTRDRHATFAEVAPDSIRPGHLMFNMELQPTGADNDVPENLNLEFYSGMRTVDINLSPEQHVRLWFVRKTDQLDVDALEHPRAPSAVSAALADSPEPGQRLNTPGVCPEAHAWQATITYPAQALRQGVYSGSVTVWFVTRPDGTTSEYKVAVASNEVLIEPTLEALARLHCSGVSPGLALAQTVDYLAQ